MKPTVFLIMMVLPLFNLSSLEAQENPIDTKVRQCIENDPSTAGMVLCYSEAEKEWDLELNRNYQLLMSVLDNEGKKQLKSSQLAWIKYRDAEFAFLETFYGSFTGTMFSLFIATKRMDMIRSRALELKTYYDDYQIHR